MLYYNRKNNPALILIYFQLYLGINLNRQANISVNRIYLYFLNNKRGILYFTFV